MNFLGNQIDDVISDHIVSDHVVSDHVVSDHAVAPLLSRETKSLCNLILEQLKRVVPYTASVILLLEEDTLSVLAYRGPTSQEEALQQRYPTRAFLANMELFHAKKPIISSDIEHDERLRSLLQDIIGSRMDMLLSYSRSWMGFPLIVGDRVLGLLSLSHSEPNYYSTQQAELVLAFANQASLAIENVRLHQQVQHLVAHEERNRLARELHDAVNQTLFSASLITEVLPRLWERDPSAGQRNLDELRQLIRGAMGEMRTLLIELHPTTFAETHLDTLLRYLTESMIGRTRVPIDLTIEGDSDLPDDVKLIFYRTAQEALTNIVQHSGATQVTIKFYCEAEMVSLYIRDDGKGFNPDAVGASHSGIKMMEERAEVIGATLISRAKWVTGHRLS